MNAVEVPPVLARDCGHGMPSRTPSFARTSSSTRRGTAAPMTATGRASVSILRIWLVRISPVIGKPCGNTTLDANGRVLEVIGHTMINRETRHNGDGEMTSAGRLPLCSRPRRGSTSIQTRSPASSGAAGSLNHFAALIGAPIESVAQRIMVQVRHQILDAIARARD